MSKRIVSIILSLALLLSVFSIVGVAPVAAEGATATPVTTMEELPDRTSLIAGQVATRPNGTVVTVDGGASLSNMTDGLIQGLNQHCEFLLTDDEQYKTCSRQGQEYYAYKAPDFLVEERGLDTSKTWYFQTNSVWLKSNDNDQRAVLYGGSAKDAIAVYDMGIECEVDSLLIASSLEMTGAQATVLVGDTYDPAKHPTFTREGWAKATAPILTDKRLLWTAKVYVGNDMATIIDPANLVLEYDLSDNFSAAERNLWTLPEVAYGRYVAFDFNDCTMSADNKLVRISELAVYGNRKTEELRPGANQVSVANFPLIPENLLAGSTRLEGYTDTLSGPLANVYDGHIGGVDVAATDESRVSFFGDKSGSVTTPDGKGIEKISGMSKISFQLDGVATIDKILVAGSINDGDNFPVNGVFYDNRHVLYYEVYVADNPTTLWDESNRVLDYDNSVEPGLAQIHLLEEAVKGSVVGFRVSCGAYGYARLSELGVYGTMKKAVSLSYEGFDSQEEMDALIKDRVNLLKGEAVDNLVMGFLPNVAEVVMDKEKWMYDGYVDWEAVASDGTYQQVEYSNSNNVNNLVYDLRGTARVDGVLLTGTGVASKVQRPQRVAIYVSDDRDTLFDTYNRVGTANPAGAHVGVYVDLTAYEVQGRYVGLMIPGDAESKTVRIAELGIYGTYVTDPEPLPTNLVLGKTPVYYKRVPARGIDNKTAEGVNGIPGTGNTGVLTDPKDVYRHDDLALLTDGFTSTRCSHHSNASPYMEKYQDGSVIYLQYDNHWVVAVYKLDGLSRIDDIIFASSPEKAYYISGVQYYASETYEDLFKNESLLYTTGGERYIFDEANHTDEEPRYLPDASTDDNDEQTIEYTLTDEQSSRLCRYVALVMTRPHSTYLWSKPTERLPGYSVFRAAEFTVNGEVVQPDEPIKDVYTCHTSVGDVTVQISTLHFDDREFFDNTLSDVVVTETKLPAGVSPNLMSGWLSVDHNNTVFTFQLVDKQGNPIPDTHENEALGLNGREMEFSFPATSKEYLQTIAVLENGMLRRIYNSFPNILKGGRINAGSLNYPVYDDTMANNRDKAVLSGTKLSLVYMKSNDVATVNQLNGQTDKEPLLSFLKPQAVAGVATHSPSPLWYILPVLAALLVAIATIYLLRRKARRVDQ